MHLSQLTAWVKKCFIHTRRTGLEIPMFSRFTGAFSLYRLDKCGQSILKHCKSRSKYSTWSSSKHFKDYTWKVLVQLSDWFIFENPVLMIHISDKQCKSILSFEVKNTHTVMEIFGKNKRMHKRYSSKIKNMINKLIK